MQRSIKRAMFGLLAAMAIAVSAQQPVMAKDVGQKSPVAFDLEVTVSQKDYPTKIYNVHFDKGASKARVSENEPWTGGAVPKLVGENSYRSRPLYKRWDLIDFDLLLADKAAFSMGMDFNRDISTSAETVVILGKPTQIPVVKSYAFDSLLVLTPGGTESVVYMQDGEGVVEVQVKMKPRNGT